MNSREKGKVGEREFASLLREHGFDARRGQQFAGGAESPDVVSEVLSWLHIEVKRTQALNLADACAQAEDDCHGKPWVVAHRRNHAPWLITMRAEVFFQLVKANIERSTSNIEHRSGDCRQAAGSTLGITPEAWAGEDQSGELKADSGDDGKPTTEDEQEDEDEDDFKAAASAAANSKN